MLTFMEIGSVTKDSEGIVKKINIKNENMFEKLFIVL